MSFGWAFLIYLAIGLVVRLIFIAIINYIGYKNKDFEDNYKNVIGSIDDLVENHSQQYDDPRKFRFGLMILGYVLWPLDIAGFIHFLFPPKE